MANVFLIGADVALLEGLAQTLATAGHRGRILASIADAADEVQRDHRDARAEPLVVLLSRELAADGARAAMLVTAGGALVLYHSAAAPETTIPAAVRRQMLADVALPLERHRLMTLIHTVDARARATGRGPTMMTQETGDRRQGTE